MTLSEKQARVFVAQLQPQLLPAAAPTPRGIIQQYKDVLASLRFDMVIISLGSNVTSRWGNSPNTILIALKNIERFGIKVLGRSRLYSTLPYGVTDQPNFINCAALLYTQISPTALLLLLKKIEASAGRRPSRRWGPRQLDIDIIDYRARIMNWPKGKKLNPESKRPNLILPHPEVVSRPFVLQPLLDIAPAWHHPVYGASAAQLLARLNFAEQGKIINICDSEWG